MCSDRAFIELTISKANESVEQGGFPAGAVVVLDENVVGVGVSIGNILNDPISHGEMVAIRMACSSLGTTALSKASLYCSMEPCLMCLGASMWSSISRIVFACKKEKVSSAYYGGEYKLSKINSELNSSIELVHLVELEEEALAVVRDWETLQL